MLADENESCRATAVDIIKSIRQAPQSSAQQVREFRPPVMKDTAETLQDLLPPLSGCVFEPPLTRHMSNDQLDDIVQQPLSTEIPCHSQAVERCVRMVSEASNAVYGFQARDGYIRAVTKSRDCMPCYETKQNFNAFHN